MKNIIRYTPIALSTIVIVILLIEYLAYLKAGSKKNLNGLGSGEMTPEQLAIWKLLESINEDQGTSKWTIIGKVDVSEGKKIFNSTGIDVTDYERVIDNSAIIHILKRHTNEKIELTRNQQIITQADFLIIPYVLKNFDKVFEGDITKSNLRTLVYEKRINGTLIYIEEIRTGRKKLALKSMWKEKA